MNMLTLAVALTAEPNLKSLLISFLVALIILAIAAGLIWCIENWISPIPPPGKTVIAVIMVICVLFWAISNFM